MYCAVIADMVDSKKLTDRGKVQDKLKTELANINLQYQKSIVSNFTITLGDEFQGLMADATHVMVIIDRICDAMYPVGLRFGIGFGDITTEIDPDQALGADGPAYHNARLALEDIKRLDKKDLQTQIKLVTGDNTLAGIEYLVNTAFCSLYAIESGWTKPQRETVQSMMKNSGMTQKKLAEKRGVEPSTVTRSLQSANFNLYVALKEAVEDAIINIWEKTNGQ